MATQYVRFISSTTKGALVIVGTLLAVQVLYLSVAFATTIRLDSLLTVDEQ